MTTALSPSSHARLSPSGAHRWMHCPGSVEAEAPFPDSSSKYADEGSAAHLLAEGCLLSMCDAAEQIGHSFPEYPAHRVTADMAAHVQTYLDYVRGIWAFCDETWTERNTPIDGVLVKLPDPTVGQGTSDAGGIDYASRTLHVSDLKFGRGVLVEAKENEQFRLYALGAYSALSHEKRMELKWVQYHVIQPRADHPDGPCRSWMEPMHELLRWAASALTPAAFAALQPGAPRAAGDHCRFCKAKGTCDTFRGKAVEAMPFEFAQVGTALSLPEPTTLALTPERVSEIYFGLDRLEEWIAAFRSFVFEAKQAGVDIPGIGLKRKRTNRKWMDEEMVAAYIHGTVTESIAAECFDMKPLSVAQLEKVAKRHPEYLTFPEHLVVQAEGDLTLCAADDPHALTTPPTAANRFTFEELP